MRLLAGLAAAVLGLYAGAMLTEGAVLVPYWRSLPAAEFFAWYRANDQRLLDFFGPLTTATVLLAVVAALGAAWRRDPGRWYSLVAALLSITTLSIFFLYFQQANADFSAAALDAERLPAELARWGLWHWVRTGISMIALAAALLALRPPRR